MFTTSSMHMIPGAAPRFDGFCQFNIHRPHPCPLYSFLMWQAALNCLASTFVFTPDLFQSVVCTHSY
ncbi:hypothetical protein BDR03DRAFT_71992 [Suillus americanus]|nr:hypothetical protein BDR03DRAFT_71992 [Suillus americanus]